MNAPAALKAFLAALLLAPAGALLAEEKTLPDFNLNSTGVSAVCGFNAARVPAVPPPTDTGYYARYGTGANRVESSVTVVVREGGGRADIVFPRPPAPESASGYRAALFIKLEGESAPVLSWATVFCSGGRYLGYKGSSIAFAQGGGPLEMRDEVLALGPLKVRLLRTHPWLAPGAALDSLCAPEPPGKLKGYLVKSLPAEAGGLAFRYDRRANSLAVTWR